LAALVFVVFVFVFKVFLVFEAPRVNLVRWGCLAGLPAGLSTSRQAGWPAGDSFCYVDLACRASGQPKPQNNVLHNSVKEKL